MAHTWGYIPFPTHLILGATVSGEYVALTDAQKEIYKIIVSCGNIDAHPGNPVIERIFNLFPQGTQTRINLETILTPIPFIP